jgi:hypothetical protein
MGIVEICRARELLRQNPECFIGSSCHPQYVRQSIGVMEMERLEKCYLPYLSVWKISASRGSS